MAEPAQERVNPDASPQSDAVASPVPLPPQTPFGLEQPIHGAGVISPAEVRQALRLAIGPPKMRGCLVVMILATLGWVLLALATGTFHETTIIILATLAALVVAMRLLIWYVRAAWKRRTIEELCGEPARREMTFSEHSVVIRSATAQSTILWTGICRCACPASLVVMPLVSASDDMLLVPRSFLGTQEEWDLLVRLVRHKLVESPLTQRLPLQDAPAAPLIDPGEFVVAGAPADNERRIEGQGTLSPKEVFRVMRHMPGYLAHRLLPLGLGILMLLPTVACAALVGLIEPFSVGIAVLGVAGLFRASVIAPRRQCAAMSRAKAGIFGPCWVIATRSDIRFSMPTVRTSYAWDHYSKWRELPHCALLYWRRGRKVQIVRKASFREEDWARLLALLREKLPEG